MSRRELAIAILLVMGLLAPLIEIPIANAIIPQDQTIKIVDTHDDKWTTGTGAIGIDSWLVHVLDPGYDVTSWVIFRDVEINNWEPLSPGNATLRLYTGNTLDFDKDSMITIYGMKVDELQNILPIGPSYAASVPKTSAHVNFNTSQFYGPSKWWNITVTDIVEELIRSPNWDGDGLTGGDTGDAIGFVMLGASGQDVRYFVDYRSDPDLSAQLRIRWNHQPPLHDPPSDDPEFIEQYRNYTIWREAATVGYSLEPMEYVFSQAPLATGTGNVTYDSVHDLPSTSVIIDVSIDIPYPTRDTGQRKMVRMSNGTIYVVYFKKLATKLQIYIKQSSDNGETWTGETRLSVDDAKHMENYDNEEPSIAVDSSDNLHVVWNGEDDDASEAFYVNYNGTTWSAPYKYSTSPTASYGYGNMIAVDSSDNLHVIFSSYVATLLEWQIFYTKYDGSWSTPIRISTPAKMDDWDQYRPNLAVDSVDNLHVVWVGMDDDHIYYYAAWYSKYDGSWSSPFLIFTGANPQDMASVAVDSTDNLHVVWYGGYDSVTDVMYRKYDGSWLAAYSISDFGETAGVDQGYPSIAIDGNDVIHVVWTGRSDTYPDVSKVFYSNYTTSWSTPENLQTTGHHRTPNLRWARWPTPANGTYFIADLNGTIIENTFDELQDAKDYIDEVIMGPDPLDPDPPGWITEGPFTRFKMRLYLLVIGYFAIWGPIWFMCWRRPSGYHICGGLLIMLMGLGLLLQIVYV